MPVNTRSVNKFASNIINNIIDNVVNHEKNKNINKNEVDHMASDSASASLGLGCCSICFEDIQFDNGRFVLECGHTFHAKCILVEFRHRNRCPMCRTEVKESSAHERYYAMPGSLRIYSSILHDAADHFIHDLGNITFANVVHRMMLLTSEDEDLRRIQYPYIKRILVQFASMFIRGVAFSIRGREEDEIQDPIPIDIVDNMTEINGVDGINDSEYDAAISNPALDAAVAYHAMVTTDMNFDLSHDDNVGSVLIRRSVALAEMGLQRSELSLRRASRIALRRQQLQEVQQLLQEALRERSQESGQDESGQDDNSRQFETQAQQNVNIIVSEHHDQEAEEDSNPYGLEF